MQRFFSLFPDGAPGGGLLLLRIALAGAMVPWMSAHGAWPGAVALLLGLLLVAGFLTPLASALYAVCQAWAAWSGVPGEPALALLALCNAGVLFLLGPGAYSADARLFGRRVLHVRRARTRRE